ncbi:hypothetical protein DesyoDRAFT_2953 [Desulfosporosinus youngiae DSM 17734]|uniref:Uncharacterized protein n=1 Tax=Desulfosporosinus youngiae DSM 17734 TaxID=768710 RepID=H5Y4W4_9FIRM|nr:hypothetical protein DesyoDRAFT_2953 [Desulfosporosinus youngiae DSM 17734]
MESPGKMDNTVAREQKGVITSSALLLCYHFLLSSSAGDALTAWAATLKKASCVRQGSVLLSGSGAERFSAVLTRAKTVSSVCTRLRVPPLVRWTVRERVRTSGYFCM